MKTPKRSLLLITLIFLQASCGTLSSRTVYDPSEAAQRLRNGGSLKDEVDRLASPLVDSGQISGMAVGVLTSDGLTRSFTYGSAERDGKKQPVSENDLFQVGSVSKLVIASVLSILADEGTLRYEDTARGILPPEIKISPSAGKITLYELITHTSGLPRESKGLAQFRLFIRYLFTGENLYSYLDRKYLYEYLRVCKVKPAEKREYQYSNIGLALLTHLIEIKTGKTFPELAEEKIFRPLGMNHTAFFLTEAQRQNLIMGHSGSQEPRFMRRHKTLPAWNMGEIMQPVGGLYSTSGDMLLFCKAHLGMTDFASTGSLTKTHEVQFETPAEGIALGWVTNAFSGGRITLHYKHGMTSGYSAYVGMNIKDRLAVVVMLADFEWDDKVGHNLLLRLSEAKEPEPDKL